MDDKTMHGHRGILFGTLSAPMVAAIFMWLVWSYYHGKPKRPQQVTAYAYPNYKLERCPLDSKDIHDFSKRKDITEITIHLKEGGYCTHVILPPACTNPGCAIHKSTDPGDYGSIWCDGDRLPKPIRTGSFFFGRDSAPFDKGGDFYNCGFPVIDFFIQGRGTVLITPLNARGS